MFELSSDDYLIPYEIDFHSRWYDRGLNARLPEARRYYCNCPKEVTHMPEAEMKEGVFLSILFTVELTGDGEEKIDVTYF